MVAYAPIVQADFSGTAFGAAPTWTDITRFARLKASPISINKWRQDELSDVAPSQMTLQLDNDALPGDATAPNAGRFTPGLSTSPWYPRVQPGVRIRAGVTVNAITYWRFDGHVDAWGASWEGGDFSVCTVSASDVLSRFGQETLRSIYLEEALVDLPLVCYPLTEPTGATSAADISGNSAPSLNAKTLDHGDLAWATATGIPIDGTSTLTMNGTLTTAATDDLAGMYLQTDTSITVPGGGNFTIEAWVTVNATLVTAIARAGVSSLVAALHIPTGDFNALPGITLAASAGAVKLYDPMALAVVAGCPDLNDGHLHHLVLVNNRTAGTTTFYVDGVSVGTNAIPVNYFGTLRFVVGGITQSDSHAGLPYTPFRGGISYVAAYPSALTAPRVTAHNTAGRTALAGEAITTRVTRLLGYRPNLGSSLDTGAGSIGKQSLAGSSLQQALLEVGKAEGGVVFVDGTAAVRLKARSRLRDPAVAATLDLSLEQVDLDLTYTADTQRLFNDVTISRTAGGTQRVTDSTSGSTFGPRPKTDTLTVATDTDALNAANWLLANNKTATVRLPRLAVDLNAEPSLTVAAAVLGLEPLSRVSLINPPSPAIATDVLVQGCTDTIGVGVFTISFNTSPLPRPTLRFDATADAFTKLDTGNVFAW